MDLRQERRARALQSLERQGACEIGRLREPAGTNEPECEERRHELRAVDEREPLLRREANWLEPDARERVSSREPVALDERLPLSDEGEREMRERCEIPGRTDRAARRHHGQHAAVETLEQEL